MIWSGLFLLANLAFVDPFVGTAGTGHTTPAATVPFGGVQAGPDTGTLDWAHCSGYQYGDTTLLGFSSTHLSGTGCGDLGDLRILPFVGDQPVVPAPFDKASETASPGYYSTTLASGIRAEMSATTRAGIFRFTYPKGASRKLLVDLQDALVVFGTRGETNRVIFCTAMPMKTGLAVEQVVECWAKRHVFGRLRFSDEALSITELPKRNVCEKAPRYVFDFGVSDANTLTVVSGLATSDDAGAQAAADEIGDFDLTRVRRDAEAKWRDAFGRFAIEADLRTKKLFYTALYHLLCGPHTISDTAGRFRGADDKIRTATAGVAYGELSLWDTYRAAHPFLTLAFPEKVNGFVNSMLDQCDAQGYLPVWSLQGRETNCMIGNPAVTVIADAAVKGFTGFDQRRALAAIKKSILGPRRTHRADLVAKLGYEPYDIVTTESVSKTLEGAVHAAGAARLARVVAGAGEPTGTGPRTPDAEVARFEALAKSYTNLFDATTGFFRGRDSRGAWRGDFEPLRICNAYALGGDFTEANAWQYLWHVQHDVPGLIALLGGREKFLAKLERLFTLPSEVPGLPALDDVSGLYGQYAHGNEPSHHVAYLFALAGKPERTQELVRELTGERFYSLKPDGVCGNEDGGQMSAWYLFSVLGFYPVDPSSGEYVLGAPQASRVTLCVSREELESEVGVGERAKKFHSPTPTRNSNSLTIVAKGISEKNKYVKSVTWNGTPITNGKIRHADLVKGGELVFEMKEEMK